ncbi:MAG: hypothetical protein GX216_10870 [Methanomicrobiales archaeon]|nr:hypothetical protein [Methanomicrobiales archaeon]
MSILRKAGILGVIAVACIVLIAAMLGQSASESFRSSYRYDLEISTSGPLDDTILLIPLPSRYDPGTGVNVTPFDLSHASFSRFDQDNITVAIECVDGIPMLKIAAGRIDPVYKSRIEPILIMPGQNESDLPEPTEIYSDRYSEETPVLVDREIHITSATGREIDTRTPMGTEPLLKPYRVIRNLSSSTDDYYVSPGASGYIIEVPFILSFGAGDENILTISSEFSGANEWWVLGWQSNSYREMVHGEFAGACNGTYPVRGILATGEGVY